jgi:hypothetical protein
MRKGISFMELQFVLQSTDVNNDVREQIVESRAAQR